MVEVNTWRSRSRSWWVDVNSLNGDNFDSRLLPYLFFLSSLQNVFPLPEISGKKKKKPQKKEKKRLKERSYLNGQSIFKGIFSNIK